MQPIDASKGSVLLVFDLPYQLLEDVFQCDQPHRVLPILHDRQVNVLVSAADEQLVGSHAGRDHQAGSADRARGLLILALRQRLQDAALSIPQA